MSDTTEPRRATFNGLPVTVHPTWGHSGGGFMQRIEGGELAGYEMNEYVFEELFTPEEVAAHRAWERQRAEGRGEDA